MTRFVLFMIIAELFAAVSQILLKKSALREHESLFREYTNPFVITGYVLLGCSLLITIYCYRWIGYLGVIVLEPLSYIMVMLLAWVIFHEKITARRLFGMLLIIGGIMVFHA